MRTPPLDRFASHRNAHLNADPTDDELQYEMEDEGPSRDVDAEFEKHSTRKED